MARDLLDDVTTSLDRLIDASEPWDGLFPSMLDRQTGEMLREAPPAIDGQRDGDRAFLGSNLMHDHPTLGLMYDLDAAGAGERYARAADRYIERFAEHCTDTVSGLFAWGEHSFWQLEADEVGSGHWPGEPEKAIHDHLHQAPVWLWQRLWEADPGCVERFAEGLDNHWTETSAGEPLEYIRHAYISKVAHHPRGTRSCDFPRHGGFYILDWSFAWLQTGRNDFNNQVNTMLDYWWEKRFDSGLLAIESRTENDDGRFIGKGSAFQPISLAASLLDTADLVEDADPDRAAVMRTRAETYLAGFLSAPHQPDARVFVNTCDLSEDDVDRGAACWGSVYGSSAAGGPAVLCLRSFKATGDGRLLDWARSVAEWYCETPFPSETAVPAADAGMALELLAGLCEVDGVERWREPGLKMAAEIAEVYCDGPLPRGAAGIGWYESQMLPGYLLHGIARMALMDEKSSCPVKIDCSYR
ncbi:MAG: hypothetical protein GF393_10245 [Armatimonadia bacterium]|nr:hypothetical protein [Armatimonadia bacterium]